MDRHLLTGAILLLIIQITVLLGDLEILPISVLHRSSSQQAQPIIGKITYAKQNVRRRPVDSLMWEETEGDARLHAYDSVLTLSSSSARLDLEGDVKIQLHENTLVVVEPIAGPADNQLRLKFSRGNVRSTNPGQRLSVGSGQWTLEASAGSDISLRSLDGEKIEVEVASGQVQMQNKSSGENKVIDNGHRLVLDKESVGDMQKISEALHWSHDKDLRLYTHHTETSFSVAWTGKAKRLRVLDPKRQVQWIDLSPEQTSAPLEFHLGSYTLSLENDDGTSSSLGVHVMPAERIRYFSPLPRDRVRVGQEIDFAWSPMSVANRYQVRFLQSGSSDMQFNIESKNSQTQGELTRAGDFYWQVIGIDEEGFEVPAHFSYPLYSVENPLAAPRLIDPSLRLPASSIPEIDNEKKSDPQNSQPRQKPSPRKAPKGAKGKSTGASFWPLWQILFPSAAAEETSPFVRHRLEFSWFPVPEAEHYIIEISSNPDFQSPEVVEKIFTEKFEWRGFEKKIYYWRVAGGKNDGTKGLFSEPARLDLSRLSELKVGELVPGVQFAIDPARKKESPKEEIPPTPPPPIEKIVESPKPQPPPQPAEPEKKPDPPQPMVEDRQLLITAWLGVAWQFLDIENSDELKGTFTGWSAMAGGGNVNFPLQEAGSMQLNWRAHNTTWEAEKKKELPLQQEIKDWRFAAHIGYRPFRSHWNYGLGVEKGVRLRRLTKETVDLEEVWHFGPSAEWFWHMEHLVGRHQLSIMMGDESYFVGIWNGFDYTVFETDGLDVFTGVDLEGKFLFGDNLSGFEIKTGAHLGISW